MIKRIEAVFDGKVLRPNDSLAFEPNTPIRMTIEPLETDLVVIPAPKSGWSEADKQMHKRGGDGVLHAPIANDFDEED